MSESLMGPSYTIKICAENPATAELIFSVLVGQEDKLRTKVKADFAEIVWKLFISVVHAEIKAFGIEHDGIRFSWECEPVVERYQNDCGGEAIELGFGINLHCKEEDFEVFEDMLDGELSVDAGFRRALECKLKSYLSKGSSAVPTGIEIEMDGFGYG